MSIINGRELSEKYPVHPLDRKVMSKSVMRRIEAQAGKCPRCIELQNLIDDAEEIIKNMPMHPLKNCNCRFCTRFNIWISKVHRKTGEKVNSPKEGCGEEI